jgi:transcriptional regulator with XRE-family HTH domain
VRVEGSPSFGPCAYSIAQTTVTRTQMTSAQIRAARGLLHWSVRELGKKAGVHSNTIINFELGHYGGKPETLKAIQRALEKAGVEFTDGKRPGVRLSKMGSLDYLDVRLEGGDIVVTLGPGFRAVYYKPAGFPRLVLRERTKSNDDELLDAVLNAANVRARKLGRII